MHLSNYPHTPGLIVRPERVTMFEITPFFPTKKTLFAKKFIGNFLLDPPTNTGVFPISEMIFIGEWRYPPCLL